MDQLPNEKVVARIQDLVKHISGVFQKNHDENKLKWPIDVLELHWGPKWCKIDRRNQLNKGASVYCFVAITDFSNKQLGSVKTGDIHMPASFRIPAKHARGSIFQEDFGNCCGPYGVKYLRG